ncbi:MAG: hypothetical protein AAF211_11530 [Myxococcota bacterium]
MYGVIEGEPFQVFARRDSSGAGLVIRFECKEGMGILGIRKMGRKDPTPSAVYEEEDIEPSALRAGRFVHVLGTGQRQSYALSRISPEVASRLPADSWTELKPQTEYGFRYLVVPDAPATDALVPEVVPPEPAVDDEKTAPTSNKKGASRSPSPPPPTGQVPMNPQLAKAALDGLTREQALEYLRVEMAKVEDLGRRVAELEAALRRSEGREQDLLEVLSRWRRGT